MKKIVLFISMISFVFSNAQTKLENDYNNLTSVVDKLDFIFNHIIKKQIADYKLLKDDLDILKTENDELQLVKKDRNQKKQTITALREEIDRLKITISQQTINIDNIQQEKEILQEDLKDLKINRNKEKGDVETEIDFIIKQKSNSYSEKILSITKERARENKVNQKLIDVLNRYISTRKKLVAARDLLTKSYNKTNIDIKRKELSTFIINTEFSGLREEKDIIIDLLYNYEKKCNTLSKLILITLKKSDKNNLQKYLNPEKEEYEDYPYLLKMINQKLNNQKNLEFGC